MEFFKDLFYSRTYNIFFNYIKDMVYITKTTSSSLFADDTNLLNSHKDLGTHVSKDL